MKHKKFLLIALICLIGIGISFLLFSAHRPFKDLEAADITSASVRLSPPDTTIQIVETEELVSYLNEVVIYNKDNSYTEYAGQGAIFTLSLADGSQVEITAFNPFIIIYIQIPCFLKNVFVGKLHHIQSFQRRADSFKVASTVNESILKSCATFFDVTCQSRVSSEIAQITPNIGLIMKMLCSFP